MTNITTDIIAKAESLLAASPTEFIFSFQDQKQTYWVKKRPKSKKKIWHTLQKILAHCVKLPIFAPTVVQGNDSLKAEAARMRLFAAHNIAVPTVIHATDTYLITSDVGTTLHAVIEKSDTYTKTKFLEQAIDAIISLHGARLCHGRPSSRDLIVLEEQLYFIDLEENPLGVMSLAEAQARDIWLFLNNAARYCQHDPNILIKLAEKYIAQADVEVLLALEKMVKKLKPIRKLIERYFLSWCGRDVRAAIAANKALEITNIL